MIAGLHVAALLAGLAVMPALAQESSPSAAGETAVATFASGCFWCTESDFEKVPGVVEAVSGYIGGTDPDPTYQEVSAGGTGHAEAVQLRYDPEIVSYERLLDVYWRNVDFLDAGGQFCDRGDQYRSAIFVHDEAQKESALEIKEEARDDGPVRPPGGHANQRSRRVPPRRGLPPGLLQEEPDPLQILPLQLRPGSAAGGALAGHELSLWLPHGERGRSARSSCCRQCRAQVISSSRRRATSRIAGSKEAA